MQQRPPRASLVSQLARLGAVGGAALALVASTESGERADGSCPPGETCAPETPDGLLFEGAPLGIEPVFTAHTIAAGGRQSYRLTYPGTRLPFDLPFAADVTAPGHRVVGTGPDRVVVDTEQASIGYLRILDDVGQLYDRLEIESADITSMRAAVGHTSAHPYIDPPRWAAFAGGEVAVTVVLEGSGGRWLVDEDLTLRAPLPTVRTGWDTVTLRPLDAGTVVLGVDAGRLTNQDVRVPVVDRFDDVAFTDKTTGVGGDVAVCFHTWQRGADPNRTDDDILVVGVPRSYRVTGPATPLASQRYGACLELHTEASGTVEVEATLAGRTYVATVDVQGSSARDAGAEGFRAWLGAPREGERALLAGD